ncbi:hypothetical protein NDI47_16450 [Microcoleus vaginatus GB1-A2]|uniref:hypothetical protein n=1 Tax=Microcoleus vaginatus TaxID=119532 RepID=UPI0016878274|nr:hypothetical protein [Microcoleus sp. FACHB-61]
MHRTQPGEGNPAQIEGNFTCSLNEFKLKPDSMGAAAETSGSHQEGNSFDRARLLRNS